MLIVPVVFRKIHLYLLAVPLYIAALKGKEAV